MSRTLLLLRHAKSDWDASYGADRDRPLARRGVEAAATMGRFITATGLEPDAVLSSPAVRARTTAELAAQAGGWAAPVEIRDSFYGGDGEAVLGALRELGSDVPTVVIVGHEPVWSGLVAALVGGGRVRFPTAAVACLTCEADWSRLARGRMELGWLVTPRLLRRSGFDG